jgi:MFS transporter, CP family, cyanate transporter
MIPALGGLCIAAGFIAGSLAPFVPSLMADLRMSPSGAGVALGAWQAVGAVASLPLGVWLDRVRLRHAVAVGGALGVASCVLRAFAHNGPELIAAVAIFGLAWTLVVGGSAKVIATNYEGRSRRVLTGAVLACVNLGFAAVVAAGTPILAARLGGWRPALLATGAPMAVATIAWLLIARAPRRARPAPPSMVHDTIDLLRHRSVLYAMGAVLAAIAIGHGISMWLPTLLRADGLPATAAGLASAAYITLGVVGALTLPVLATSPTRRWWVGGTLLVEAVVIPILIVSSAPVLALALFIVGITTGAMPPLMLLALYDTEGLGNRAGAVTGLYYAVAGLAGLLGPLVVGWLVGLSGGFEAGLVALAAAAAAGAVLGSRMSSRRPLGRVRGQPEVPAVQ